MTTTLEEIITWWQDLPAPIQSKYRSLVSLLNDEHHLSNSEVFHIRTKKFTDNGLQLYDVVKMLVQLNKMQIISIAVGNDWHDSHDSIEGIHTYLVHTLLEPDPSVLDKVDTTIEISNNFLQFKKLVLMPGSNEFVLSITLPSGTDWKDLTIRILNDDEALFLAHNKPVGQGTSASLGFATSSGKPNAQWKFLKALAYGKELSTDVATRKQKELVTKKLKKIFGLPSEPFHNAATHNSYKPKFRIEPEDVSDRPNEIEAFRQEQAPIIAELDRRE